jgi:putative membrane protein
MNKKFNENYPAYLFLLFVIIFLILGISPKYRGIWMIENVLTILLVLFLVLSFKKFRFSNFSYSLIFIFLVFHVIGSYYSYNETPLFDFIFYFFNVSRNNYDRVIHFLFGVLFFYPCYEFLFKKLKIRGVWCYLICFFVITAFKGFYEIFEWLWILITGRGNIIETHFLGMQGDLWDAQKDMILGVLGSFFGGFITWLRIKKQKL